MPRVTVRIKGGLGNQLFMYAAARRLALVNQAELVIDHISGFLNDPFQRQYCLHHFALKHRLVSPGAPIVSWGRYKRGLTRRMCRLLPFDCRPYLAQERKDFDPRMLTLRVSGSVYLDGYWQSEGYFRDVESDIRSDLHITSPHDPCSLAIARDIDSVESVSLHTRFLQGLPASERTPSCPSAQTLSVQYWRAAVRWILQRTRAPHFFVFTDCPEFLQQYLAVDAPTTLVCHNRGDANSYEDLWLMSLCQHHIIANSTFSWWGAWLGTNSAKLVVAPGPTLHFGHEGLVPSGWLVLRQ